MTTITEILAESFNRVKAEHGVTLSRVDFSPASGAVGVAFRGVGCSTPVAAPAVYNGPLPPQPPEATHYGIIDGDTPRYYRFTAGELFARTGDRGWCRYLSLSDFRDAELVKQLTPLSSVPKGATHYGALEGSSVMYWKYHDGLLGFRVVDMWAPYTSLGGKSPSELVRQLTPLNPTSQSAADSDS